MATGFTLDLDLKKVKKEKVKDGQWLKITCFISDQTDDYNNNISAFHYQTKEERDSGADRHYVANGRVFWTDGTIVKAEWKDRVDNSQQNTDREEIDLF